MRRVLATVAGGLMLSALTGAQGRPKADIAPFVEAAVHPGDRVRVALRVRLPEGVHVQSNAPRDPLLIPTVLTIEPATGVDAGTPIYPPSTDFIQAGQKTPLAVFEQEFVVGVTLTVGRDASPGEIVVPARLRYQACDASTCFAPVRESMQWTVTVVAPSAPAPKRFAEVFDRLASKR